MASMTSFEIVMAMCFAIGFACDKGYTVQSGDTCWAIWTNNGMSEQQFYDLNPGINCNDLQIGQVVCISGSSGGGPLSQPFSGHFTYYTDSGYGACGTQVDASSQMLVAVAYGYFTSPNPNNDPLCGQCLKVTYNGKSITVPIKDKCPSCANDHMDLSLPAFRQLADPSIGNVYGATFQFVSC
uniref:LysM domain-containing protein n=1 Tax=Acrobeloides nanus TaxID=290746 RepID=A0A914EFS5_9BILA